MQSLERNFEVSNKAYVSENKANDAAAEESLQATLLKLVTKKRHRKKIERIIEDSGPQILTDCDPTLLLLSARKHRNLELFVFILESKPKTDVEVPDLTSLTASIMDEDWPTANQLHCAHVDAVIFQLHGQGKLTRRRWYDSDVTDIEFVERIWARSFVVPKLVARLSESGLAIERVAKALHELRCDLDLNVGLGNAELTKAHLLARRPRFDLGEYESTYRVLVKNRDVAQLELYLDYNLGLTERWVMPLKFLYLILDNIHVLHGTEDGRNFTKMLPRYDISDEYEFFGRFESAIMRASRENLEVFFEYEFRTMWMLKYKVDILASAFGNRDPDVLQLLKYKVTDVETRGSEGQTPLQFAMEKRVVKSIGFLLSRGADPNAKDKFGSRALGHIYERVDDRKADVECVRLLLIGGADPLLVYLDVIKKWRPQFFGIYAKHSRPEYKRIVEYLVAELAVREVLGRSIEKPMEDCRVLMGNEFTDDFYEGCRRQIDQLKNQRIRDNLSMFSLLSGREGPTVRISEDDRCAIASFMRSYKKDKTIMLYYHDALKYRIKMMERINLYIDATKEVLSECMGICDSDHLVIRKILNYLTLKDILARERKF